ncbi:hypothetical protein IE077_000269 [Cardiosporidium cionae]|uniref:Vesicle-fusing ATPase n=1 Tax=Cardiosporidium cionae TaxID=476202 RepID=A0ABQ7J4U7_9APIC|nr:hypothetical protein IE077_000269 [Cardiosporidium cionae]|eukprot:KAF8818759.1 hypothetical protein IE077_000269 [Cardiosporidium cionae]
MALRLSAVKLAKQEFAFTNKAYVNNAIFNSLNQRSFGGSLHCEVKSLVLNIGIDNDLREGEIGLSTCHRESARIQLREELYVRPFLPPTAGFSCGILQLQVSTFIKPEKRLTVADDQLENICKQLLVGQIVTSQQVLIQRWEDNQPLKLIVTQIFIDEVKKERGSVPAVSSRGFISDKTQFIFEGGDDGRVLVRSKKIMQKSIFTTNFNFEELGIGGLDREFADIFRRAFASRVFPPAVVDELGITHVRGDSL